MVEELEKLSKVKDLKYEEYERKEYLGNKNITEARVRFSERSKMFKCKMSYQNDPAFKEECWMCDSCQSAIDDMAYQPLREGKDMNSDSDIIEYLVAVSRIRAKLGVRR